MERTAAPRKAPLDIAGGRAVLSMLIDKHSFTGFDPVSSWNGAASSISMLEIATLSGSQFPAKTPRKLLERVRSALTIVSAILLPQAIFVDFGPEAQNPRKLLEEVGSRSQL